MIISVFTRASVLALLVLMPFTAYATDLEIRTVVLNDPSKENPDFLVLVEAKNTSTAGGGPLDSPNTEIALLFPNMVSFLILNLSPSQYF